MSNQLETRRSIKRLAIAGLLTASMFAVNANAAPPQREHFQIRGLLGALQSSSVSADGCSQTAAQVLATQNITHNEPGGPVTTEFVRFELSTFNFCTGASLFLDVGGNAVINGSLQKGMRATASVSGIVFNDTDNTERPVNGTMDLIFSPTSPPQRTRNMSFSSFSGEMFRLRSVANSSDASVSGTLVVDGTDYLTTILASDEVFASIENSDSGTLDIIKR
jgi:hypothetical protein